MALKHYSHYRNSDAATNKCGKLLALRCLKVYLNISISLNGKSELMFQHVRSISGLDGLTPTVGNVVQKYMQKDIMLLLVLIKHLLN